MDVNIKNRRLYKQIFEEVESIVDTKLNEMIVHQYDDIPRDLFLNHAVKPDLIADTWRKIPNNVKSTFETNSELVAYICNLISNEKLKSIGFDNVIVSESNLKTYNAKIAYTRPPAIGNMICEGDDYSDMFQHKESDSFSSKPEDLYDYLVSKYDFESFGINVELVNTLPSNDKLKVIRLCTSESVNKLQLFMKVNKINEEMNKQGWYIGTIFSKLSGKLTIVQYEPAYYPECTSEVFNINYLYHVTPVRNIDEIKKNGLKCSSNNQYYAYNSPRLYLMKKYISIDRLRDIAYSLSSQRNESKDFYNSYYVLTIDISKLSNKNIHFYEDPNAYDSVFCYDNIPANAIVSYYKLCDFNITYNKDTTWFDKLLNRLKEFFNR